jgi:lipopolysaccharide transport system permease protein
LSLVVTFGVQLWMYATPVVYPLSQIPGQYRYLFVLNPMVAVVEGFRLAFLGVSSLTPQFVVASLVMTLILLLAGLALFSRVEKTFMDTV